jgi:restriction endonuclease
VEKLKMHSPNFAEENIARLADLFPGCVTESKDENRNLKKVIDFDLLRQELDTSTEVIVYAKLPKGFFIPTPVGNYNPDWAISFKEGTVKHVYFVAETKGSMSSMELREIEKTKIECARRFFNALNIKIGNRKTNSEKVKYDVVNSFGKLMEIVGAGIVSFDEGEDN